MNDKKIIFENINYDIAKINGHVGYYFFDLVNHENYGYKDEEIYLAASVIKLPILLSICELVYEEKTTFNETLHINNSDKLPSCGGLNCFTNELDVDIETLCNLMIRLSDNTATNILIKHYGIDNLNNIFEKLGFKKTRINRLLFDEEAASKGLENKICLKEIGDSLIKIYRKEFINEQVSAFVINMLLKQQINHKIPGYFNGECEVAHKTGEDEGISNDVGIVYAKCPFVICFAGNEVDVSCWETFIRKTSKELLDSYNA